MPEITGLHAYLTFAVDNLENSCAALVSQVSTYLAGSCPERKFPLSSTRYKRLSAVSTKRSENIDALWDLFSTISAKMLAQPPVVVAVDESIWNHTYVTYDPDNRIIVLIPHKPEGIGPLGYLLITKLLYSELPFLLDGLVRSEG